MLAVLIYEKGKTKRMNFVENCVDYKNGGKFQIDEFEVRKQTLIDFAEYFIKTENEEKYDQLIADLPYKFKDADGNCDIDFEIKYIENLILLGCKKSANDLLNERFCTINKNRAHKFEQQIKNYEEITGSSYKQIYDSINKPENRIPQIETHHYIDAYEKLNNQK